MPIDGQRGFATWMWADMLLSPTEFPESRPVSSQRGNDGYGKPLRQQLPRDIVM